MRVNLAVPFRDKDAARRLGARWDSGRRVWYVENRQSLAPFLRWMPRHLKQAHKGPQA